VPDSNQTVVLITGAGSGIGEAIARKFAGAGSSLALIDINEERLVRVKGELEAAGARVIASAMDVTDSGKVRDVVKQVEVAYGRLDVLCNSAGIMDGFLPVTEMPEALWHRVMDVNLTAPYLLSKYALEVMLRRQKGAIVNIASTAGMMGGLAGAAYVSSKHGLIGLTKNIAWHFALQGIRCNVICPGSTRTNIRTSQPAELSKLGWERSEGLRATMIRQGEADEIAEIAFFLASDASSFVNGAVIPADAGWTAG
jgi:NAD(P)-dependent dehydrogenase (short-subunit alcohol dehydrogenase family)